MKKRPISFKFYSRSSNEQIVRWREKIAGRLSERGAILSDTDPDAVIVLGGDGTIIEAARAHIGPNPPLIVGLNLGTVGFLAAESDPSHFLERIGQLLQGDYLVSERVMLFVEVRRADAVVFSASALNEIAIQNILGMVELDVVIGGYTVERIRGSGVLIATPTGSTAYNLSAHGPLVSPDLDCIIITELLDHNIPTPSIVVGGRELIEVVVTQFRERALLALSATGEPVNVIATVDGRAIFPLHVGDLLGVSTNASKVPLVEFEPEHFFRNLHAKFPFS